VLDEDVRTPRAQGCSARAAGPTAPATMPSRGPASTTSTCAATRDPGRWAPTSLTSPVSPG